MQLARSRLKWCVTGERPCSGGYVLRSICLLMDLVKGLGKIFIFDRKDKDQIVERWWEIPIEAELETRTYQMSCDWQSPQIHNYLPLSFTASNRLDNKSKSHVSGGNPDRKEQLSPDSPIKPQLWFSLRHELGDVKELSESKPWWKWNTAKSWKGGINSVP